MGNLKRLGFDGDGREITFEIRDLKLGINVPHICDRFFFPLQLATDIIFRHKLRRNLFSVTKFYNGFDFPSQFATEFVFHCKVLQMICFSVAICD